jgi:hypothetical protein
MALLDFIANKQIVPNSPCTSNNLHILLIKAQSGHHNPITWPDRLSLFDIKHKPKLQTIEKLLHWVYINNTFRS